MDFGAGRTRISEGRQESGTLTYTGPRSRTVSGLTLTPGGEAAAGALPGAELEP